MRTCPVRSWSSGRLPCKQQEHGSLCKQRITQTEQQEQRSLPGAAAACLVRAGHAGRGRFRPRRAGGARRDLDLFDRDVAHIACACNPDETDLSCACRQRQPCEPPRRVLVGLLPPPEQAAGHSAPTAAGAGQAAVAAAAAVRSARRVRAVVSDTRSPHPGLNGERADSGSVHVIVKRDRNCGVLAELRTREVAWFAQIGSGYFCVDEVRTDRSVERTCAGRDPDVNSRSTDPYVNSRSTDPYVNSRSTDPYVNSRSTDPYVNSRSTDPYDRSADRCRSTACW